MPQEHEDEAQPKEDIDLILENEALQKDLEMRGMVGFEKSEDLDPAVENQFLNEVWMMEEAMAKPFCKVRDLFSGDPAFPPGEELDDERLSSLLGRIKETLAEKQIYISLNEGVPDREVYRYFLENVLDHEVLFEHPPEGFSTIVDGCDGGCPECFQKPYCTSGPEWDDQP